MLSMLDCGQTDSECMTDFSCLLFLPLLDDVCFICFFLFLIDLIIFNINTHSLRRIHGYTGQDITLRLPGNTTVFDVEWIALYCITYAENFGSVFIPERRHLNIPADVKSLVNTVGRRFTSVHHAPSSTSPDNSPSPNPSPRRRTRILRTRRPSPSPSDFPPPPPPISTR